VGEVFLYDEMLGYAALEVGGPSQGSNALVCIGGLTDGLLSLRYMPSLAKSLQQIGWRTFQPVLQSSYRGWGFASLHADASGIDRFLSFLHSSRGVTSVVLLGSSTGCQDAVQFLKEGEEAKLVKGMVLQAPVSDREALLMGKSEAELRAIQEYGQLASDMIRDGKGDEILPRAACELFGPPDVVSAYRFDSLTRRLADDDMFSSDFSEHEMMQKLGHIHVPTLIAMSKDDEYVPDFVDLASLGRRMANAMAVGPVNSAECLFLESGGHGVRGQKAEAPFVEAVASFVSRLDTADVPVPATSSRLQRLDWAASLAADLRQRAVSLPPCAPFLVALAGMPGSGKSTTSQILSRLLHPDCLVLPMDGFHTKLADLKARADSQDAVYRRGAPDTFDAGALKGKLEEIRSGAARVKFPEFDHARGDPVDDALCYDREVHRIVLVEGLYLLHAEDGWRGVSDLFDYRMYLDADIEDCIRRVKERNKVIPGYTVEEIERRCDEVDRANAKVVQRSAETADVKIHVHFSGCGV